MANRNPIWIHPQDAVKFDLTDGDMIKVNTEIGYFVDRVWVTEGMKPGVIACSHHLGRWRRPQDQEGNRWATNTVSIDKEGTDWKMSVLQGIRPFKSSDNDSSRIFWSDGGVHQNITLPVHPDPISGMHCWHQKGRLEKVGSEDRYGDIFVDTKKSHEVYKKWMEMTRPASGANNLRKPLWFARVLKPTADKFYLND